MNANDAMLVPSQDLELIQATVLAAAIQGDGGCRIKLPSLYTSFEEPYRTVAAILLRHVLGGEFVDQHTLLPALEGKHLVRRGAGGNMEELAPSQVLSLICGGSTQPGQADAYLGVLQEHIDAKRRMEFTERVQQVAREFGDSPEQLLRAVQDLVAHSRRDADRHYQSEVLKFIPYFRHLLEIQTGASFTGLDSGFQHVNQICNGLETGLIVVAARPSAGKTTPNWQICQQAAKLNRVPVIFVSMEQSERELRAKSLARLAKLNSRHISRGRLRSDDAQHVTKLQQAGQDYFDLGRFLTIVEGDDTTTVEKIGEIASVKMARAGVKRCLIALDYLQILPVELADAGRVTSPKDRVDMHVSALRRLARRLDSPVIAISSENRAGYSSKELDVFKESGGIEYSADIAAIMTVDKEGTSSAQNAYRVVDLNIVKNRNGEVAVVKFKFYPERAEFVEMSKGCLPPESDG